MKSTKITALLLTLTLIFGAVTPAAAAPSAPERFYREEAVYAKLTASGGTREIYAVNTLHIPSAGIYEDYGIYTDVRNLTDFGEIARSVGGVSFRADAGAFYYQGTLPPGTLLPWKIAVGYTLNGAETAPETLGGEAGSLAIHITVSPRDGSRFAEYYLLRVTVTLDSERCADISAPQASAASAGTNRILTFTVLPGAEGAFDIAANVSHFEMAGIEFAAVPYTMDIEFPDLSPLTERLAPLTDAAAQLNRAGRELKTGASSLASGSYELTDGADSFGRVFESVAAKGAQLNAGADSLAAMLEPLLPSLPAEQSAAILESLAHFKSGLFDYTDGIDSLSKSYSGISSGISGLAGGLRRLGAVAGKISAGLSALDESAGKIPGELETQIDEIKSAYTVGSFAPVSFVSDKNTDTTAVQFAMITDKIEKPVLTAPTEPEARSLAFWDRLINLFK
ncbi:MAG: hypothetical protein LBC78_05305 [Oscillospiraceae bacterium]|jgi:hypothetical protein|nr:hypothetical protein [Oscillospiraceae bacterium]